MRMRLFKETNVLRCLADAMQFKGQTVLIGVDDMDLFKGIELKLLAVERVLDYHPEWRGRLVLVQVTNAPRCVFCQTLPSPGLKCELEPVLRRC